MCRGICERVAKRIVGRSQMDKTCTVNGDSLVLRIEESIFIQFDAYRLDKLDADANGFQQDVDMEMVVIGCGARCEHDEINIRVDKESNLFVFSYEFTLPNDGVLLESVKTHEWLVKEV